MLSARPLRFSNVDVYVKKLENKVKCVNCQGYGPTTQHYKECANCGKNGHPTDLYWEKKKEEKRGLNAAELFEVEVRTLVQMESVAKISSLCREDETSVNQVDNIEKEKKRLLHIK